MRMRWLCGSNTSQCGRLHVGNANLVVAVVIGFVVAALLGGAHKFARQLAAVRREFDAQLAVGVVEWGVFQAQQVGTFGFFEVGQHVFVCPALVAMFIGPIIEIPRIAAIVDHVIYDLQNVSVHRI